MADLVLTPQSRKALQEALLAAFSTRNALDRLVRFGLGESLSRHVPDGSLEEVVFHLLEWAEAQGRLRELVSAAHESNPGNPRLADFVAQQGLTQRTPEPPPAIPPGIPVDTTDPDQLARIVRAHLAWRYPSASDAMRLASDAGIDRTSIDFSGPREAFWTDTVSAARRSGRLLQLVEAARAEHPEDTALLRFTRQLAAARLEPSARWTPERMYDALLRLLPVQFDEVVFRLGLPSYYLPPSNAPLAERAQGVVRLLDQQARLDDLAALLDRMKVTRRPP